MNMKAKKGQTKLLAAVAVFAMVLCVFAVAVPSDVEGATIVDAPNLSDLEGQTDQKTYSGTITKDAQNDKKYTIENYVGPAFEVDATIEEIVLKGDNVITFSEEYLVANKDMKIAAIYATGALKITGEAGTTLTIDYTATTNVVENSGESAYGIYATKELTMTDVEVQISVLVKDKDGAARGAGIYAKNGVMTLTNVDGNIVGSNRAISASYDSSEATREVKFLGCNLNLEGAERALRTQDAVTVGSNVDVPSIITATVDSKYGSANSTSTTPGSNDEVAIKVMALTVNAGSTVNAEGIELSVGWPSGTPTYEMDIEGTVNVLSYEVGDAYKSQTPTPGMNFGANPKITIGADAALNVEAGFVTGSPTIIMKTEAGKEDGVFSMAEEVTAKDFEPTAKKNDGTKDTFISPYAEGNKLVLGSTIYTLYNMEYDVDNTKKAILTYGVGVTNPIYDGDTITIGDLMVVAKPVYWTLAAENSYSVRQLF